jgi:hypothetical protein
LRQAEDGRFRITSTVERCGASLGGAGVHPSTLCWITIGDRPGVADLVRYVGCSDRAHAAFSSAIHLLCDIYGVTDLDARLKCRISRQVSEQFVCRVVVAWRV